MSDTVTAAPVVRLRGLPRRRTSRLGLLARRTAWRAGRALLVVIAATMLTQWLLSLTPGGLSASLLGEAASPEAIGQLDRELGLDRNFFAQYFSWAGDVLQGDLGRSPVDHRSVMDMLRKALPVTVELVVLATVIALTAAIVTATVAARRPNGWFDRLGNMSTSVGLAVPTFVLAPIAVYFFAVKWHLVPVTGWVPLTRSVSDNLRAAVLPAVTVAIPEFAIFQRVLRGDLVATLEEDYIDAARARGISEPRILTRHAFRPASLSLLTLAGLSVGRLLGGTLVVEALFVLPGVGTELQGAITRHDFVTVKGFVVFLAVSYVVINLIVDVLYGIVDPRIKAREGR